MKLVTVEEMRQIEQKADNQGLTYELMMENAGHGLSQTVEEIFSGSRKTSALGLVGPGNNGGDTLVALSNLGAQGWEVSAYLVKPRLKRDPLVKQLELVGGEIISAAEDKQFRRLNALIEGHAVLFDGVLGTGVRLPIRGVLAKVLSAARKSLEAIESPPFVVAVDCPSGVDCDSGAVAPDAIPAGLTVTMAAVKTGLLRFPAFEFTGDLRVVDIGLPADLKLWKAIKRQVASAQLVRDLLPERPLDAHKGTFGRVIVVAGSVNYSGAALLAGEAAYRVGAGLVTMAVPGPLHTALAGHLPEATWILLPHEMGVISSDATTVLRENMGQSNAMVLGPGFGVEDTTRDFMTRMLKGEPRQSRGRIGFVGSAESPADPDLREFPPLTVDADGLKLLAKIPDWYTLLPKLAVLTPHPGEMSILTGLETSAIQADRLATAERFAAEWEHIVVLKGALTVIAAPDGNTTVIPVATPALARAGTGDVLTGLIAGLQSQGMSSYQAAIAGAWIHAQAGMTAAQYLGNTSSVLARDVMEAVTDVVSDLH